MKNLPDATSKSGGNLLCIHLKKTEYSPNSVKNEEICEYYFLNFIYIVPSSISLLHNLQDKAEIGLKVILIIIISYFISSPSPMKIFSDFAHKPKSKIRGDHELHG